MANTAKLLEALSNYTGNQETLDAFVNTANQELGADWGSSIHQALPGLPPALKEKLDHAFNYYGATLSWNEVQSYLTSQDPLDIETVSGRIETLSYWLNFFGEQGAQIIEQLKDKLEAEKQAQAEPMAEEPYAEDEAYEEELPPEEPSAEDEAYEEELPPEEPYAEDEAYEEELPPEEPYAEDEAYAEELPPEEPYAEDEAYEEELPPEEPYTEDEAYEEELPPEEPYAADEAYEEELPPEEPYAEDEAYEEELPPEEPYAEDEAYEEELYDAPYDENAYDTDEDAFLDEADTYTEAEGNTSLPEDFWRTPVYVPQKGETTEEFMAKKTFHQSDFLNAVRCWINARCIAEGNKEIYFYRHYGFLIDVMEETKKDLKEVLSSPKYYPAIEQIRPDGIKQLQSLLTLIENDLEIAYDNLPSELTDLINDTTNANDLRNALGGLDTSNKPELLGAAPDGFEMLEDPFEGLKLEPKKPRGTPAGTAAQKEKAKKSGLSFNKKNASS